MVLNISCRLNLSFATSRIFVLSFERTHSGLFQYTVITSCNVNLGQPTRLLRRTRQALQPFSVIS